jgi:hypothetical protein
LRSLGILLTSRFEHASNDIIDLLWIFMALTEAMA